MASTVFVNGVTLSDEDFFNDINRLHYTIFSDPADVAAVKATLHASPGAIGSGTPSTGAFTTLSASSTLAVTGASTLTGRVGIGGAASTDQLLDVTGTHPGSATTLYGFSTETTYPSTTTGTAIGAYGRVNTAVAAFTLTNATSFYAASGTVGAGSTVTNVYGFFTENLVGGTNNYGFRGGLSSGANKYNLYMDGTAVNFLEGALRIGTDSTNNGINDASTGAGTTTLYIGNAAITVASDERLKENIVDTQRDALAIMDSLRVVDHTWNDPSDQCKNNRNARGVWTGLIAQEADKHIPWIVNRPREGDEDFMWHMDLAYMAPLFVKAFQQQSKKLKELADKFDAYKASHP